MNEIKDTNKDIDIDIELLSYLLPTDHVITIESDQLFLGIYLSIYLSNYLSNSLCMYLSMYVSIYVCIYLPMHRRYQ
jgi:hypothetical protein